MVSKKAVNPICNLISKDVVIKQVQKFKYPEYIITFDGKYTTEVKRRITMAKDSLSKVSPILKYRNISMSTKLKVLKGLSLWVLESNYGFDQQTGGSWIVVYSETLKSFMEKEEIKWNSVKGSQHETDINRDN